MKKSSLLLALTLALFSTHAASAQIFVGSDNFDAGATAKWDYVYRMNGATQGDLSFTNNRLDFLEGRRLGQPDPPLG